jgi:hypothetical protein
MDNQFMSKVNTDKKLELIRAIRMQNQYDRQLIRMREGIVYSDQPDGKHGELYGLEEPAPSEQTGKSKVLVNFRIRFVIAVLLLLGFILCDVNHITIGKEDADSLYTRIKSSTEIEALIDKVK